MTGEELKEIMETVLPASALQGAVEAAGFEQRERKRDALKFLRAMLASASSPAGGRQADIMRTYFENGAPRVARGAFYDWFGPPLEEVMKELSKSALTHAASQPKDLPGALGCVEDWLIVDSTTVKLHDHLKAAYPGAGNHAALKVHKTLSVGHGTVIALSLEPGARARFPAAGARRVLRGKGLLVDLGYASLQRLRDCRRFGMTVVMRLKENWKHKVERIVRGDVSRTFLPGTDLDVVLTDEVLTLGNAIVADVTVGPERIPMRLCGVHVPERGYCFYLTNLSRSLGPRQVADIYRVRWEIEINNKLDKSSHRVLYGNSTEGDLL